MSKPVFKRLLSLLLVAVMIFSSMSITAFADETDETAINSVQNGENAENGDSAADGDNSTEQEPEAPVSSDLPDAEAEENAEEQPIPEDELSEDDSQEAVPTSDEFVSETHTVFRHTEQTLAPGVTNYTNYAYANDGKQMVYYVTTADLTRDDVVAQVAYKDMQNDVYGMDKLSNMVASANEKYSDPENPKFMREYYNGVTP